MQFFELFTKICNLIVIIPQKELCILTKDSARLSFRKYYKKSVFCSDNIVKKKVCELKIENLKLLEKFKIITSRKKNSTSRQEESLFRYRKKSVWN